MSERFIECDHDGLEDCEAARLTGYSSRAVWALCHLREAWCVADNVRQPLVEIAAGAILQSLADVQMDDLGETAMRHGLGDETGAKFVRAARATIEMRSKPKFVSDEPKRNSALIALDAGPCDERDFDAPIVNWLLHNNYARTVPNEGLGITAAGRARLAAWRKNR